MALFTHTIMASDSDSKNDGGFGIKAGVGLTTFGFSTESAMDQKNRMKVGGFIAASYEKRFGKVFALDFELGYANKGAQQKGNYNILGNTGTLTVKYNLHCIELPISGKFYIGDNFNINIGPYVSYYFLGHFKTIKRPTDGATDIKTSENLYDNNNNPQDAEGDRMFRHFDAGANVGLEFVSNMGLGVGTRFQNGFVDFTNPKYGGSGFGNDGKWVTNTGIQIYLLFRM